MIESVNSVVQSTPITRADLQEFVRENSVQLQAEVREPARAPFISPVIAVNVEYDTAVLEIRNSSTGDVIEQIPSDPRLEAQLREQARLDTQREIAQEQFTQPQSSRSESAQTFVQDVRAAASADVEISASTETQSSGSISTPAPAQQVAAFETAARSGNSNAGSISLFA